MELDIGLVVLFSLGILAAVLLYLDDRRNTRMEAIRLDKMRNSAMYMDLYDIIRRCRKRYVEQVRLHKECVVFTMLMPAGRRIVYSFGARGYHSLNEQRLRALSLLLEQDMPVLADKQRYKKKKQQLPLPNGEKALEYLYVMQSAYKDALNRAPYYM